MPGPNLIYRLITASIRTRKTAPIRKSPEGKQTRGNQAWLQVELLEGRVAPAAGLTPADEQLVAAYGQLPLSFEANAGQTAAQVQYLSQGSGYTLFLTATGSVLSLQQPTAAPNLPAALQEPLAATTPPSAPTTTTGVALAMNLVGSNPQATVTGQDQLPGISNYFIGN